MGSAVKTEKAKALPHWGGLLALLPAGMVSLSLASLLLVVLASRITSAGYDIQRLEGIKEDWKQLNYQLEAEIASLKSLERVEREAKTRFKMVPATQQIYVTVDQPLQPSPATAPYLQIPPAEGTEPPRSLWQRLWNAIAFWKEG